MSNTTTDEDLQRVVKDIAEELTNPEGWLKRYAEEHELDENDDESIGAHEWLEDVLDIRYTVGNDRQYIYGEVLVAFGGPNIWVNFGSHEVEGYWGGDKATAPFSDNLGVDDALSEMWDMQ